MTKRKLTTWLGNAFVLALVFVMLVPVIYMILMSFRTGEEIAADPLGLPSGFFLGNYANALENMNYARSVLNSVGITLSVTVLVAFVGSLAAYPLARATNAWGRAFIMLVALGLATPAFVTITPIYVIFRNIGLLDSYPGIILAFTALNLPLAVFFYVGFIGASLSAPLAIDVIENLGGVSYAYSTSGGDLPPVIVEWRGKNRPMSGGEVTVSFDPASALLFDTNTGLQLR